MFLASCIFPSFLCDKKGSGTTSPLSCLQSMVRLFVESLKVWLWPFAI